MTEAQWQALSQQLTHKKPGYITVALFAFDIALLVTSWFLSARSGLLASLGSFALMMPAIIHVYLILHEAIHHTAAESKWLNNAIGHLCGWIIALPFLARQRNHLLHHVWAAHPTRDPENAKLIEKFAVMTKAEADKVNFIWRTWLPVMAFNHIIATWRSPFERMRNHKINPRYMREARWVRRYAHGYVAVAVLLTLTGSWAHFAGWFLPAWLVLLMAVEALNLPHHAEAPLLAPDAGALPYWEQGAVSHDCGTVPVWSKLFILNFNLHVTHHQFPNAPWHALRWAHELLHDSSRVGKNEFAWSITNRRRPLLEIMGHFFDKQTENRGALT